MPEMAVPHGSAAPSDAVVLSARWNTSSRRLCAAQPLTFTLRHGWRGQDVGLEAFQAEA